MFTFYSAVLPKDPSKFETYVTFCTILYRFRCGVVSTSCPLSATAHPIYLHPLFIAGVRLLYPLGEDRLCHGDREQLTYD